MKQKKSNKKRRGLYQFFNLAVLIFFLIFFLYWIVSVQNSDQTIGQKIAQESYINEKGVLNKGDWMWNMGEFLAIMSGWAFFIHYLCVESGSEEDE